jgi:hypothetical protein
VFQGGQSWGKHRHWQPVRRTEKTAVRMARRGYFRGRPGVFVTGSRGSITSPSLSGKSVGEGICSIPLMDLFWLLCTPFSDSF